MSIIHRSLVLRDTRSLLHMLIIVLAFMLVPVASIIAQSQGPSLTLSPPSAPAGSLVLAYGTGFPASATGLLYWSDGSEIGSFVTDPDGNATIEILVPDVEPGVYTVSAAVETAEGVVTADASLTVEAVSEPPTAPTDLGEPEPLSDPPMDPTIPVPAPTEALAAPPVAPTAPAPEPTEVLLDPPMEPTVPGPGPTEALEVPPVEPTTPAPEPTVTPFYSIAGSSQSDNSPDATVTYDGDPSTYWITDAITPAEAFLTLDLGEIRPIASTRWLLATNGTLTTVEIQLSEDGANWVTLVTLDGANMQAGGWSEHPVDAWARYIRFVAPNPNGLLQIGGFAEIEIWPASGGRPLSELVTPDVPTPTEAVLDQPTATAGSPLELTGQGVVTGTGGDGVNCRVAPELEAASIIVLAENTVVDLTGPPTGEWQPVICNGQPGFVSAQFVQPAGDAGQNTEPAADATATAVASPSIPAATAAPSTPASGATEAATPILPAPVGTATHPATEVGSPTAVAATATPVGPLTFAAVLDATVHRSMPDSNFGNESVLVSDRSPQREMYVSFNVSGVSGPVQQATLRLWVTNGTQNGPKVFVSSNTSWSETEITWNTRPASGTEIADVGTTRSSAFLEYDVTSMVSGNGSYTFALIPDSSDGLYVNSREASSNQPELVLNSTGNPATPVVNPTPTQPDSTPPSASPVSTPANGETAILLAAGDIATCRGSGDDQTADILDGQPGTVATLGDNVYQQGTAAEFANCYDPTWGRHKDRTKPSAGNHDYRTSNASGYFDYFGASAGDPSEGYYSYDLGAWHVVVLNSNIDMGPNSAQVQWLRDDLASSPAACTLAYWHHPRFSSSSEHGNSPETGPLFETLYEHGAEIVLNGHDHTYERFGLQNPDGQADPNFGIRQFVVGTAGGSLYGLASPEPNSEVRNNTTFGVLRLTLSPNGYTWNFLPVEGKSFTDFGSGDCHGAPGSGSANHVRIPVSIPPMPLTHNAVLPHYLALQAGVRRYKAGHRRSA